MKIKFFLVALLIVIFVSCEEKATESLNESDLNEIDFKQRFALKSKYDKDTDQIRYKWRDHAPVPPSGAFIDNIDGDWNNDGTQDWGDGSNLPSIDGDFENDGTKDWDPDINSDGSIDIIGDGINVDGDGDLNNDGIQEIGDGINIDGDWNNDGTQDWGDGSNVPSNHIEWDRRLNYDGDINGDGTQDIGDGSNIDGDFDNDGSRDWGLGINIDGDNDINNDGTIDISDPLDGDIDGDGDVDWGDVNVDGTWDYVTQPASSELPANETPITDWDNVALGNIGWMSLTEGDGSYSYNMDFRELGLNDTHASTHAFRVVYFFDDPNATGPADVTYFSNENIEQWDVKKGLKSYEGTDTAPWYEHNIGSEADGFFQGNPQRVSAMLVYDVPNTYYSYSYYFKGISEGYGKTKMQVVGIEYWEDPDMDGSSDLISKAGDTNLLTPYIPI